MVKERLLQLFLLDYKAAILPTKFASDSIPLTFDARCVAVIFLIAFAEVRTGNKSGRVYVVKAYGTALVICSVDIS